MGRCVWAAVAMATLIVAAGSAKADACFGGATADTPGGAELMVWFQYGKDGPYATRVLWVSARAARPQPLQINADLDFEKEGPPALQALKVEARLDVRSSSGAPATEAVLFADGVEIWRGPYPTSQEPGGPAGYGVVRAAHDLGERPQRPEVLAAFRNSKQLAVEARGADGAILARTVTPSPDLASLPALYRRTFSRAVAENPPGKSCAPPPVVLH